MNDKSNKLPTGTSLEVVHRNLPYQYLVRLPRKTDSNRGGMAFARFLEKLPQAGDSCSRIRVRLNPEEASGEAAERRFVTTGYDPEDAYADQRMAFAHFLPRTDSSTAGSVATHVHYSYTRCDRSGVSGPATIHA
jgi:hypothetical protein